MNHIKNTRRGSERCSLLFLFLLLILVLRAAAAAGEAEDKYRSEPSLVERAIGVTGFNTHWDAFRSWANVLAWMNLRPPDASFRQESDNTNVMTKAAARSFETSRETVEQTAESAAKFAGEAVERTANTIKRTLSPDKSEDTKSDL